jgi:hypothetical protein
MPLQPWMKLISVDDHLIEHPMVWQGQPPPGRGGQTRVVAVDGDHPASSRRSRTKECNNLSCIS